MARHRMCSSYVFLLFYLNLFSTRTFQGQTPSMQILNPNLFSLLMDQIKNVKHDMTQFTYRLEKFINPL